MSSARPAAQPLLSPCREVCVWVHTDFLSLYLWHSNTQLCPWWSRSSAAGRTGSGTCLWRWWCGSWGMGCSKCYHYSLQVPSTPAPSLGAGESSSNHNHCLWRRIHRQHKWGRLSARASQVLGPNSAASPGTGLLRTKRISPSQSGAVTTIPIDPGLTSETLTLGSHHHAKEKTQESHLLLDHSSAFLGDLSPVWGESCELPQPESGFYPRAWREICMWGTQSL